MPYAVIIGHAVQQQKGLEFAAAAMGHVRQDDVHPDAAVQHAAVKINL